MSAKSDNDIIDQKDYEEFEGVPDRTIKEEAEEDSSGEDMEISPEHWISPSLQLAVEHTFVQAHFCKVTSCEYCGDIIASIRWHQGLRCTECSFDCHYDCAPMAPKNCLTAPGDAPPRPDLLQPHNFYEKHFSAVTFCNICRKMLYGLGKQGFACATCQFISHEDCLPKSPINCPPQKFDAPLSQPLRHYWVEGNLSGNCTMCKSSLSKMTILYGFRCAYCSLKTCPACFPQFQHDQCDEGIMAPVKFSPAHLITHATDIVKHWTITVPEDRRPLLVFINKKSGGQVGKVIAQRLSRLLNPNQIVDLSQGGPMPMLKVMQKTKAAYRILACGGDGTAAWLLSALDKLTDRGATYVPPVAVLPLGTGNDLARVLGWGGGYDNESLGPIVMDIMNGHEVYLDRWRLDIENVGVENGLKPMKIMNNYFSIGIDAKIALDFHRKREANPSQFKSRGFNKLIYAGLGAGTIFEGCPNLSRRLQVQLDGQLLALPKTLEGIMAINLASYAGGKNPWGNPPRSEGRAPQSPCDGLFELIGISTSFHLGQIQTYLVDGIRLGQGRDVTFTWIGDDTLPVQLDGEPWEEPESIIRLSFFRQSRMIASPKENSHWTRDQWLEPLNFSEPVFAAKKSSKNRRGSKSAHSSSSATPPTSSNSELIEIAPKDEGMRKKKAKKATQESSIIELEDLSQDSTVALQPLLESIPDEPENNPPRKKAPKDRSLPSSDPALPSEGIAELSVQIHAQEAPAIASTSSHESAPLLEKTPDE